MQSIPKDQAIGVVFRPNILNGYQYHYKAVAKCFYGEYANFLRNHLF